MIQYARRRCTFMFSTPFFTSTFSYTWNSWVYKSCGLILPGTILPLPGIMRDKQLPVRARWNRQRPFGQHFINSIAFSLRYHSVFYNAWAQFLRLFGILLDESACLLSAFPPTGLRLLYVKSVFILLLLLDLIYYNLN